ncbi:MAG: AAA family ATPase [Pseudomonadota bacterium]
MAGPQIDALLARLAANPGNAVLRLAVIRALHQAGEASQALAAAFELDPAAVANPTDRALLAEIFASAGLADDAAAWRTGATPAPAAPLRPAQTPVAGVDAEPGLEPEREPEDRATGDPPPDNTPPDDAAPKDAAPENTAPEKAAPQDTTVADLPRRQLRLVGGQDAAENDAAITLPEPPDAPVTFADVGGLAQVKRDIQRRIIAPFQSHSLVSRFRRKSGGGVLLYGPPGCGKTMIARATAGECKAAFHTIQVADILARYQGESEGRMSAAFDKARADAPAILFFDEVDALASKRAAASASHVSQLVSVMLTEIDGAGTRNDGVLVLAATNLPWAMDAAFLRPGRFDRLFFVPPPDREAREAILRLELAERPQAPGLDTAAVAAKTAGLSGADLADIVERAADIAIDATLDSGREVPIDQRMLTAAMGQVRSSVTDWLTTARNHATYANESGRYDDILAFLKQHGR